MAERKLRSVPSRSRKKAPDLRDAVADAIEGMAWLKPSDDAIKALALKYADEIEAAVDRAEEFAFLRKELIDDASAYKRLQKLEADCNATKTIGWLGQQLQGVLRDLGGTPVARKAMKSDQPVGGSLARIRAAAAAAGEDDS